MTAPTFKSAPLPDRVLAVAWREEQESEPLVLVSDNAPAKEAPDLATAALDRLGDDAAAVILKTDWPKL